MSTILKNSSETVAHTPGRASSIGVWILQGVLAAIIAGGGIRSSPATRSWWTCSPPWGWPVAPVPGGSVEVVEGLDF